MLKCDTERICQIYTLHKWWAHNHTHIDNFKIIFTDDFCIEFSNGMVSCNGIWFSVQLLFIDKKKSWHWFNRMSVVMIQTMNQTLTAKAFYQLFYENFSRYTNKRIPWSVSKWWIQIIIFFHTWNIFCDEMIHTHDLHAANWIIITEMYIIACRHTNDLCKCIHSLEMQSKFFFPSNNYEFAFAFTYTMQNCSCRWW